MFFRDDNKVRINQTSISTFIGADTKIEGTLISGSSIRIEGSVVGGVCAEGTVVLAADGQIQGNVIAENIIVAGVVDGNLTIKDKTNIEPTGEVYGDINTARILIDEQSVFQGKCNMNVDRTKSRKGKNLLKENVHAKAPAKAENKTEEKKEPEEKKNTETKDEQDGKERTTK
ncbi:MAG: polymer-forming cytoskeletal protein [Lachnospiraceae bacterium]|nr:polymer-forming cytoskeletal protein [Lachnospiraceae bacterium]